MLRGGKQHQAAMASKQQSWHGGSKIGVIMAARKRRSSVISSGEKRSV